MPNLTWTHYRELHTIRDETARHLYMQEATKEMWSVRTLHRNISSQYYYRLLQSQAKDVVIDAMKEIRENADIRFSTQSTNFNVWGMPFFTESKRHIFDTAIKQSLEI